LGVKGFLELLVVVGEALFFLGIELQKVDVSSKVSVAGIGLILCALTSLAFVSAGEREA
jgi:hypothetical protein